MSRAPATPSAPIATRPRLAFLGVGWIGRQRLRALVARDACEPIAVVDPDEQAAREAAAEVGAQAVPSLDDLHPDALDGVVIATPNALHAQAALAALERGLAVFCQKPLAATAAETRAVVEAARRADRLLAVDLSYRTLAAAAAVRERVRAGGLGDVFAADLVFHNAYGPDRPWFYDRGLSGGGCVLDLGSHLVDLALWTLGFPGVGEVSSRLVERGRGIEEYAEARLELEGGAVVSLACSWNLPLGRDAAIEASFYGSRGGARIANVGGSFFDFRAELMRSTSSESLHEPPDDWGGRAAVDWARRLAAGEGFDPDARQLVRLAETIDRIYGR